MTFEWTCVGNKGLKEEPKVLFVQRNGQSDEGVFPYSKCSDLRGIQIYCGAEDKLNFKLCHKNCVDEPTHIIREGEVEMKAILDTHKKQLKLQTTSVKQQDRKPLEFSLNLLNEKRQQLDTLLFHVAYDPMKKYEGEVHEPVDITKVQITSKKKISFYRGKCPTRNLFSFFDASSKDQKFNAYEKGYQ